MSKSRTCIVCGKEYVGHHLSTTCSKECKTENRKKILKKYNDSTSEYRKEYYKNIPREITNAKARECYARNKEMYLANLRAWKLANPEKNKQSKLLWKQNNKEKVQAQQSKRRAAKLQRYAQWDQELTAFVTEEAHHLRGLRDTITGFKWHVDHVLPLQGKNVSGLHVWNNLAVIPAKVNLSKGNKCLL